jgi:hypothetical protein
MVTFCVNGLARQACHETAGTTRAPLDKPDVVGALTALT